MAHGNVERQDIYDYRSDKSQAERHITSEQQKQSANDLARGDDVKVMRCI